MKELPEARIYLKNNGEELLYDGEKIEEVNGACDVILKSIKDLDRECAVVLSLSTKLKPLNYNKISIGTEYNVTIPIKNVFKPAILDNASYIIFFHNHPDEEIPYPSRSDIALIRKLIRAGNLLNIKIIDNFIAGGKGFHRLGKEIIDEMNKDLDKEDKLAEEQFIDKFEEKILSID